VKNLIWGAIFLLSGSALFATGYTHKPWIFGSYVMMGLGILLVIVGFIKVFGATKYERKLGLTRGNLNLLAGFILALLVIGLGVAFATGKLSISPGGVHIGGAPTVTTTASEEMLKLNLPVKLLFYNKVNGSVFTPTQVQIYLGNSLQETLTPTNGYAISQLPYLSGTVLTLKIVEGSAFYFTTVTVPSYSKAIAEATHPTVHLIKVDAVDVPSSLTIRAFDQLGNAIAAGSIFNVTSVTPISISVINAEPNTALPDSFYNPVTGSKYGNYVVIKITGTTTNVPLISGATPVYTGTGVAVYVLPLENLPAKTDVRSGSVIPASQSFGISIDPAGLVGNYTVTISAYTDLDISYMQKAAGTPNTDAVLLGSLSFTVQT